MICLNYITYINYSMFRLKGSGLMAIINDRLKERRLVLGLTLLEVANFIGVKEATVQRYESGAIKNIKHETIAKLSEILKCSPAYIMGWEDSIVIPKENQFPLTDLEKNIIRIFRTLSPGERDMFLRSIGLEQMSSSIKMA